MSAGFDHNALREAVRARIGTRAGAGNRLAREAGLSRSTASRVLRGESIGIGVIAKLCAWLAVPFETFAHRDVPPLSTMDAIEDAVRSDMSLRPADALALSEMMRAAYRGVTRREEGA